MFSKMAMQHTRQAPGRDIHRHFSLAPARSHTITASSKASATAATRNPPPHPDPYKTGPKLAKRRRGHHTCHSLLSLPPTHLLPRSPTLPHTSNHECAQTVKGGETPPACAPPLSGVQTSSTATATCAPPYFRHACRPCAAPQQAEEAGEAASWDTRDTPSFRPRHRPSLLQARTQAVCRPPTSRGSRGSGVAGHKGLQN